jgi:Fe-S-cluster containining protein
MAKKTWGNGLRPKSKDAPPPAPLPKEHEELCNHCGKCCYKKLIIGKRTYITPFPCDYLDTETNLCTIYETRREVYPECLSIEVGLTQSAFPEDCPYVPVMAPPGYKPAHEDYDWSADWQDFDAFADEMEADAATRAKLRARGPTAPPMHVEAYAKILADPTTLAELMKAGKKQ